MVKAMFSTPYDCVVSWDNLPEHSMLLLSYQYRNSIHYVDVTGHKFYTITNLFKAFAPYRIVLYGGDREKLFYNEKAHWGRIKFQFATSGRKNAPEVKYILKALQKHLEASMEAAELQLFLRLHDGTKCNCLDNRKTPDPRCPICYGTGIVKGYEDAIPSLGLVIGTNTIDGYNFVQPGRALIEQTQIKLPYSIELRRNDVVFDRYARIAYRVVANHIDMVGERSPVMQTVTVTKLEGESPIYEHPTINNGVFEPRIKSSYLQYKLP